MAVVNRVVDSGVPRAAGSDIIVYPVYTDIGVPTDGFATYINDATRSVNRRISTYPANRTKAQQGHSVPLSPVDGVIRY